MVLSGTLRVVLLCSLSLCLRGAEAVDVDQNTLSKIINYIQTNYGFGTAQFAVAISVPGEMCRAGVTDDQIRSDLLPNDPRQNVRNAMNGDNRVYRGEQLIGAKPKPIPGNPDSNYHSEYLLLIQPSPDNPLIQELLERNPADNCLIFYTFNSPCSKTCSTPNKPYSIIPALDRWFRNYNGPKAFVFGQVWVDDLSGPNAAQWEKNIREVDARVWLYRCDNAGCTRCVNNNGIDPRCKKN